MAPRIQQPDEAEMLVLFLANELPEESRQALLRRLEAEPALRTQVRDLQAVQGHFTAALVSLDEKARLDELAAARRASYAMRGWLARRADALLREAPRSGPRHAWWLYPLAAAAAVIVGFLLWWGNTDRLPGPTEYNNRFAGGDRLYRGMGPDRSTLANATDLEEGPQLVGGVIDDFTRHDNLLQVEHEMLTLQDRPQDWDLFENTP